MKNKRITVRSILLLLLSLALVLFYAPGCSKDHDSHKHGEGKKHADSHKDEHAPHDEHDAEHAGKDDGHGHEEQSNVGEGKAVTRADETQGIQLSEKALKTIGLFPFKRTFPTFFP